MSFVQVKDALATVRAHYKKLTASLDSVSDRDQQMGDLARRVREAEAQMATAVSSLEDTASEATLSTWLQFFPDEELVQLHKAHERIESMEELLDYYRDFNQKLVELFELVSRSIERESAREVFERLSQVEAQNARDVGWAAR